MIGQWILLNSDSDLQLIVYCDSDWSAFPITRRSLGSYVALLGGSPISSAEAEYRDIAAVTREINWLRNLMTDLGFPPTQSVHLFCDSQAAIHIAANPVFHERTKYIEPDFHSVRDAITDGILSTIHVHTQDQLADILTKVLGRVQFTHLLSKLSVQNLHAPI